jgi:CRP/FNR family transcriptional regulator, nitrogen oxide reductase regulator
MPTKRNEAGSDRVPGSPAVDSGDPPAVQPTIFSGISEPDRELISSLAERRKVSAGEVIVRKGEKASYLFLLTTGRAKYYRVTNQGQEIVLWWLAPGEVFGLASLLASPPGYMGGVEAIEDCEIMAWRHKVIRNLAATYPQLSENALRITLIYLSIYSDRHAGLVAESAEQRLAHVLINLGLRTGNAHHDGVEVNITNENLGNLADVGPFTASRLLSGWERQGAIRKKRGKVVIQSPEKLPVD